MKRFLLVAAVASLSIIWTASAQSPNPLINGTPGPWNFNGTGVTQVGQTFTFSSSGGGDAITSPNSTIVVGGTAGATTLDLAGGAGQIMAGATPALTSTPQLGASGTLGSITMGNATSGLLTLQPASGALGTVIVSIPAANDTLVNLAGTQTLVNKILTTPTINGAALSGTLSGTPTFSGLDVFSAGINLSGASSPLQVGGSAGTATNCLLSAGAGATPTWGSCPGGGSGTVNSGTATNFTYYAGTGTAVSGTPKLVLNADNSVQSVNSLLGPECAAVSASGATSVNLDTANCLVVTATASTTLTFTNTNASGGPWDIALVNNGSTTYASWTLPGSASCVAIPYLASNYTVTHISFDGTTYRCSGASSSETASILRGFERAAPATPGVSGSFAWWMDSTDHDIEAINTSGGIFKGFLTGQDCNPVTGICTTSNGVAIVTTTGSQTLTNKTITSASLAGASTVVPSGATLTIQSGGTLTCAGGSTCPSGGFSGSPINPQTATYQALASDFSNYKNITVASGTFTITLVASGSQPTNGQYIYITNYGSGTVTVARSGQNINGGTSSLSLTAGTAVNPTGALIWSDGTNYFASVFGEVSGTSGVSSWSGDGTILSAGPGTGALTAAFANQSANTGLWGPASGSAAAPTFRAEVVKDLPAGTTYSVTPVVGSSDTVLCSAANGSFTAFTTTISRPAFTQTAGADWRITPIFTVASTATALTFQVEMEDSSVGGGHVIYLGTGGNNVGITSTSLITEGVVDEQILTTGASASLIAAPVGTFLTTTLTNSYNTITAQTVDSTAAGTISFLLKCNAGTASNSMTLDGINVTRVY